MSLLMQITNILLRWVKCHACVWISLIYILLLSNKLFESPISPTIGNLSNLELLQLSSNKLNGELPSEIGLLTNLTELYLYNNSFSGTIPPEIGNLQSLWSLGLSTNNFSGEQCLVNFLFSLMTACNDHQ